MQTTVIISIIYLLVGVCLTIYWWNKDYKKSYNEAKTSEEGVEDGMVDILLAFLLVFWPIALTYKLWLRYIRWSKTIS